MFPAHTDFAANDADPRFKTYLDSASGNYVFSSNSDSTVELQFNGKKVDVFNTEVMNAAEPTEDSSLTTVKFVSENFQQKQHSDLAQDTADKVGLFDIAMWPSLSHHVTVLPHILPIGGMSAKYFLTEFSAAFQSDIAIQITDSFKKSIVNARPLMNMANALGLYDTAEANAAAFDKTSERVRYEKRTYVQTLDFTDNNIPSRIENNDFGDTRILGDTGGALHYALTHPIISSMTPSHTGNQSSTVYQSDNGNFHYDTTGQVPSIVRTTPMENFSITAGETAIVNYVDPAKSLLDTDGFGTKIRCPGTYWGVMRQDTVIPRNAANIMDYRSTKVTNWARNHNRPFCEASNPKLSFRPYNGTSYAQQKSVYSADSLLERFQQVVNSLQAGEYGTANVDGFDVSSENLKPYYQKFLMDADASAANMQKESTEIFLLIPDEEECDFQEDKDMVTSYYGASVDGGVYQVGESYLFDNQNSELFPSVPLERQQQPFDSSNTNKEHFCTPRTACDPVLTMCENNVMQDMHTFNFSSGKDIGLFGDFTKISSGLRFQIPPTSVIHHRLNPDIKYRSDLNGGLNTNYLATPYNVDFSPSEYGSYREAIEVAWRMWGNVCERRLSWIQGLQLGIENMLLQQEWGLEAYGGTSDAATFGTRETINATNIYDSDIMQPHNYVSGGEYVTVTAQTPVPPFYGGTNTYPPVFSSEPFLKEAKRKLETTNRNPLIDGLPFDEDLIELSLSSNMFGRYGFGVSVQDPKSWKDSINQFEELKYEYNGEVEVEPSTGPNPSVKFEKYNYSVRQENLAVHRSWSYLTSNFRPYSVGVDMKLELSYELNQNGFPPWCRNSTGDPLRLFQNPSNPLAEDQTQAHDLWFGQGTGVGGRLGGYGIPKQQIFAYQPATNQEAVRSYNTSLLFLDQAASELGAIYDGTRTVDIPNLLSFDDFWYGFNAKNNSINPYNLKIPDSFTKIVPFRDTIDNTKFKYGTQLANGYEVNGDDARTAEAQASAKAQLAFSKCNVQPTLCANEAIDDAWFFFRPSLGNQSFIPDNMSPDDITLLNDSTKFQNPYFIYNAASSLMQDKNVIAGSKHYYARRNYLNVAVSQKSHVNFYEYRQWQDEMSECVAAQMESDWQDTTRKSTYNFKQCPYDPQYKNSKTNDSETDVPWIAESSSRKVVDYRGPTQTLDLGCVDTNFSNTGLKLMDYTERRYKWNESMNGKWICSSKESVYCKLPMKEDIHRMRVTSIHHKDAWKMQVSKDLGVSDETANQMWEEAFETRPCKMKLIKFIREPVIPEADSTSVSDIMDGLNQTVVGKKFTTGVAENIGPLTYSPSAPYVFNPPIASSINLNLSQSGGAVLQRPLETCSGMTISNHEEDVALELLFENEPNPDKKDEMRQFGKGDDMIFQYDTSYHDDFKDSVIRYTTPAFTPDHTGRPSLFTIDELGITDGKGHNRKHVVNPAHVSSSGLLLTVPNVNATSLLLSAYSKTFSYGVVQMSPFDYFCMMDCTLPYEPYGLGMVDENIKINGRDWMNTGYFVGIHNGTSLEKPLVKEDYAYLTPHGYLNGRFYYDSQLKMRSNYYPNIQFNDDYNAYKSTLNAKILDIAEFPLGTTTVSYAPNSDPLLVVGGYTQFPEFAITPRIPVFDDTNERPEASAVYYEPFRLHLQQYGFYHKTFSQDAFFLYGMNGSYVEYPITDSQKSFILEDVVTTKYARVSSRSTLGGVALITAGISRGGVGTFNNFINYILNRKLSFNALTPTYESLVKLQSNSSNEKTPRPSEFMLNQVGQKWKRYSEYLSELTQSHDDVHYPAHVDTMASKNVSTVLNDVKLKVSAAITLWNTHYPSETLAHIGTLYDEANTNYSLLSMFYTAGSNPNLPPTCFDFTDSDYDSNMSQADFETTNGYTFCKNIADDHSFANLDQERWFLNLHPSALAKPAPTNQPLITVLPGQVENSVNPLSPLKSEKVLVVIDNHQEISDVWECVIDGSFVTGTNAEKCTFWYGRRVRDVSSPSSKIVDSVVKVTVKDHQMKMYYDRFQQIQSEQAKNLSDSVFFFEAGLGGGYYLSLPGAPNGTQYYQILRPYNNGERSLSNTTVTLQSVGVDHVILNERKNHANWLVTNELMNETGMMDHYGDSAPPLNMTSRQSDMTYLGKRKHPNTYQSLHLNQIDKKFKLAPPTVKTSHIIIDSSASPHVRYIFVNTPGVGPELLDANVIEHRDFTDGHLGINVYSHPLRESVNLVGLLNLYTGNLYDTTGTLVNQYDDTELGGYGSGIDLLYHPPPPYPSTAPGMLTISDNDINKPMLAGFSGLGDGLDYLRQFWSLGTLPTFGIGLNPSTSTSLRSFQRDDTTNGLLYDMFYLLCIPITTHTNMTSNPPGPHYYYRIPVSLFFADGIARYKHQNPKKFSTYSEDYDTETRTVQDKNDNPHPMNASWKWFDTPLTAEDYAEVDNMMTQVDATTFSYNNFHFRKENDFVGYTPRRIFEFLGIFDHFLYFIDGTAGGQHSFMASGSPRLELCFSNPNVGHFFEIPLHYTSYWTNKYGLGLLNNWFTNQEAFNYLTDYPNETLIDYYNDPNYYVFLNNTDTLVTYLVPERGNNANPPDYQAENPFFIRFPEFTNTLKNKNIKMSVTVTVNVKLTDWTKALGNYNPISVHMLASDPSLMVANFGMEFELYSSKTTSETNAYWSNTLVDSSETFLMNPASMKPTISHTFNFEVSTFDTNFSDLAKGFYVRAKSHQIAPILLTANSINYQYWLTAEHPKFEITSSYT